MSYPSWWNKDITLYCKSESANGEVIGVVERAGWENPSDHRQGFGMYVRIKKDGTNERYYFGHLSEVKVKVGQHVKVTDVIGIEGSTGKSNGSHCHYCCRNNASKSEIRDICKISGIPNAVGTYDDEYAAKVAQQAVQATPTPAPANTRTAVFAVGERVRMANGAPIYGTNKKYASFVCGMVLYVRAVNGNKITVSTVQTGPVTGNVDKQYLIKT